MRASLLVIAGAVAALTAVVLIRTVMHTPPPAVQLEAVAVNVDESRVAEHLAEAIRFPTISHQAPGSLGRS